MNATDLVPGRSCDNCTMCCKLMAVDALAKPRGSWCPHCDHKQGCKIYEARPEACRIFYCGYRRIPHLDERWKPSKAKFLVNYETAKNRIVIHADPARPDAWRAEPYYSVIKGWAANAAREKGLVVVWTGPTATAVLPERDKHLGAVRDDQILYVTPGATPTDFDVSVIEPDDPRATGA